jgi:putative DNA primase/helicase
MTDTTFVDASEIFERMKRKAQAERDDPFTMDPDTGLWVKVVTGSGRKPQIKNVWISAPFEIVGRVRDPRSESWAWLLHWQDDDKREHEYAVSDSDLHGDVSALCATLATRGLKIVTGPNRRFLAHYLNTRKDANRVTIVPRTGWHVVDGKKVFALAGEGIGFDGRVILAAEVTASHHTSSGTLEEWQNSVAKLAQAHSRARFAVACAFVSPLLALIGVDGGGINLRGPSSIGKTTLLTTAASVWGRGDERGFIRTWRGTGNGIEAAATQFSDTFLPLDEIGVASASEVGNVIYSIAGGVGKQRANRDGSAKLPNTWRTFILSTGEISIADKIREGGKRARAGQEIRVLDLNADAGKGFGVFDTGEDPEQLARDLRQASINFYGTAGPAFIRAIIAKIDEVAAIAQESLDTFRDQVAANVQAGQVLRAANRIGLVAVAGELAIQLGILPAQLMRPLPTPSEVGTRSVAAMIQQRSAQLSSRSGACWRGMAILGLMRQTRTRTPDLLPTGSGTSMARATIASGGFCRRLGGTPSAKASTPRRPHGRWSSASCYCLRLIKPAVWFVSTASRRGSTSCRLWPGSKGAQNDD